MKTWMPREIRLDERIARSAAQALAISQQDSGCAPEATEGDDPPPLVAEWLTRLRLLYGVPFEYLVADARMLPTESIRFFYVDRNWLELAVEGALSVGVDASSDLVAQLAWRSNLRERLEREETEVRPRLRGLEPAADTVEGGTTTGLLFRSVVVSGWPGLEVRAFEDVAATQPLSLLRMDRLSEDVLLCLFNGLPELVEIGEPPEDLHFGVIKSAEDESFRVLARGLGLDVGGTVHPAGIQLEDPVVRIDGRYRAGPDQPGGVLDLEDLAANMLEELKTAKVLPPSATEVDAGAFAIQMVRAAGQQRFESGIIAAEGGQSDA